MAEWSDIAGESDAAKNLSDVEFGRLIERSDGLSGLDTCVQVVSSLTESIKSLDLRAALLTNRIQTDSGEEAKVARALKSKLDTVANSLRNRCSVAARRYMQLQDEVLAHIAESAETFDAAMEEPAGEPISVLEHLAYQLQEGIGVSGSGISPVGLSDEDQIAVLGTLLSDIKIALDRSGTEMIAPLQAKIDALDNSIRKCRESLKKIPGHGKWNPVYKDISETVDEMSLPQAKAELLKICINLFGEQKKPLKAELDRMNKSKEKSDDVRRLKALRMAISSLKKVGGANELDLAASLEGLLSKYEERRISGRIDKDQVAVLEQVIKMRKDELEDLSSEVSAAQMDALDKVISMLEERRAVLRSELKNMPHCTSSAKARYEARQDLAKRVGECSDALGEMLDDLRHSAGSVRKRQLALLQSLVDILKKSNRKPIKAPKALDTLKSVMEALKRKV